MARALHETQLHFRQLKQVEDFLSKNGVKTLRKLKAVKFEDLIFGNATPQGVKIFLRQAFEVIEEEKGKAICVKHALSLQYVFQARKKRHQKLLCPWQQHQQFLKTP